MPYRIDELRGKMTLDQLADKMGYSRVYIQQVKAGKRTPSNEFLEAFASAVGVTLPEVYEEVKYLAFREDPAPFRHQQQDAFEKAWSVAHTYAIMTGIIEKASAVDMTRFTSLLEREIAEHGDIPTKERLVALAKQAGCV